MQIALFQPDIAGNVGTILRTAACFGVPAHIIEPCGFPFSDQALRRAGMDYAVPDFTFEAGDVLLLGAESSGVPPHVHAAAAARVAIPMRPGFRSLNVAVAAGIALAEALRQTKGFAS
jgi:tRNA (cytidine/uridine-2'-O-)-methyltransferase